MRNASKVNRRQLLTSGIDFEAFLIRGWGRGAFVLRYPIDSLDL